MHLSEALIGGDEHLANRSWSDFTRSPLTRWLSLSLCVDYAGKRWTTTQEPERQAASEGRCPQCGANYSGPFNIYALIGGTIHYSPPVCLPAVFVTLLLIVTPYQLATVRAATKVAHKEEGRVQCNVAPASRAIYSGCILPVCCSALLLFTHLAASHATEHCHHRFHRLFIVDPARMHPQLPPPLGRCY